ncbi:transporter [Winogradskya humida]|uniref:Transporter n=1 Tax=Winogradskya humida TaxID=113566 RepID=A0ABQ3ZNR4_9ACTN|nr:transporter [Actinoplanes humidus]
MAVSARYFVRLKLRLLANGLRGRTQRVALFVIGAVMAAAAAVSGYALFSVIGVLGEQRAAEVVFPLAGSAVVLGWLFLPLIIFGVDESLDPARFALLPLRHVTLVRGLFAASLVGVPAIATFAATLGMVHAAAMLGGFFAATVELVGLIGGILLCAALSRAVTSAFATALRSRRSRDLATVALAGSAALLGPLQLGLRSAIERADWQGIGHVVDVLAWTPLGAPYSMGLDVATGRLWAVPIKIVVVAATIALLLWWWSGSLEKAMLGAKSGSRERTASQLTPVAQLVPRWLPRNRFGALAGREMRYWWRETRRRATLISFVAVALFLPVLVAVSGGPAGASGAVLVFVAALAAVSLTNQFGFEGSAYAANVVAGVPGRVELAARATGLSVYVLPPLLVISVIASVVPGRGAAAPALIGTVLAAYGVALAVAMPISVRAAYALPDSTSPFAMSSGGGTAKGLLSFAALIGATIATAPLQIGAWLLGDVWLWIGLPVGIAYGAGGLVLGLRLAAPMLDDRMPELLATVSAGSQ